MIAAPLNDRECLTKVSEVAVVGTLRPDLRRLANQFAGTASLAAWIRALPQRDDDGNFAEGPRVACDVAQRVRLIADDPNCVERSVLYIAAAEVIDPIPVRQLVTIDTPNGRHTFPLEDGRPVKLDPLVPRNALRAGIWALRQAAQGGAVEPPTDAIAVLGWLCDVAADVAGRIAGPAGVERVDSARAAIDRLLAGSEASADERDDVLYAMRAAGDDVALFGDAGVRAFRVARRAVARLLALRPPRNARVKVVIPLPRPARVRINSERAVYWAGKAIATGYGLGGLYDLAYPEVTKRPSTGPRSPPARTPVTVKVHDPKR